MKYIILKASISKMGVDYAFPFTFSEKIVHEDAAKRFAHLVHFNSPYDSVEVLSAGFAHVAEGMIICAPGSETLKIKKEHIDSEAGIRDTRLFFLHESTGGIIL